MTLPTPTAFGKAVLMTAAALIVIKIAKPYLPAQVQSLLPI